MENHCQTLGTENTSVSFILSAVVRLPLPVYMVIVSKSSAWDS
jgi:hypothetical protein